MQIFVLLVVSVFWCGCVTNKTRQPSEAVDGEVSSVSLTDVAKQPIQLDSWFAFLNEQVKNVQEPTFNSQTCQNELRVIKNKLNSFDFNQYSDSDLKTNSSEGIKASWKLRSSIHNQLSNMDRECRLIARDIFHQLHDHEDYYGEFAYPQIRPEKPEGKDFQKEAVPILNREAYAPYNLVKDLNSFQFEPGDIILARGTSFLSAIITQLTDNRSHFSHAVVVVENTVNGQPRLGTVESYTTTNVKFFDLNEALKNENVRLLVLRPKNSRVAVKAAEFALQFSAEKIKYDFDFNFDDYSKLSCVEVAKAAYDLGSDGQIKIPENPAMLNLNNSEFLKRMNFKNGPMITPGDLEFDSHFNIVLDWRDYRLVRNSRYKDVVMSEIVNLMDEKKYVFISSGLSKIASTVVLPSRSTIWWPLVSLVTGVKEINPLTPVSTVDTMAVIDQVANMMLTELQKFDESYQARYKRPMTNRQLRKAMKSVEERDKNFFQKGKSSFHQFFKPETEQPN